MGGIVIANRKIHALAFADDIVIFADRASKLKDMIRAIQGFARRRRISINVEKSKIIMFSKGSRCSGETWTVEDQTYEEVETFTYLGVTMQRNGQYTKHRQEIARKANRRATEVWSLAERLFGENFRVRQQMYESLVLPIMLYATEITGFANCEEFEKVQRRYMKWTLALPPSTPTAIINRELGWTSVRDRACIRAIKFENGIRERQSITSRAAYGALTNGKSHKWGLERSLRLNGLGWSVADAERQINVNPCFWWTVRQRIEDVANQERAADIKKYPWYTAPKATRAEYLYGNERGWRTVAKFRCGAGFRGLQRWRGLTMCGACGEDEEIPDHVVSCIPDERGRSLSELLNEDGAGIDWLEVVLKKL